MGLVSKKNEGGGDLVVATEFAIMDPGVGDVIETIKENLGESQQIGIGMLDRVKTPAGGSTTWALPTIDGDVETKEIDAIIIHSTLKRAFWRESYEDSGGGTPPDCSSDDCKTGIGDPGGPCVACPNNEFPADGGSKPCAEQRVTFFVTPEDAMPKVLLVQPGSLQAFNKYLLGLGSRNIRVHEVVTRLTLKQSKNKKGITYSEIVASRLSPVENKEAVKAYVDKMVPFLSKSAAQYVAQE